MWEGSKFWKQFFEASANVSLEGYDDAHVEDSTVAPEETEYEVTETTQTFASEALEDGDATITDKLDEVNSDNEDILSSPSMAHAHSTPRVPSTIKGKHKSKALPPQPIFADYPSPYEAMRREMEGQSSAGTANPTTPGKGHALPDMSMTPQSSPFMVEKDDVLDASERNKDTILHQGILNRTYRVAATPHRGAKKQATTTLGGKTPGTANRTRSRWLDETMSSPDEPTPQLRAELFSSPVRQPRTPGASVVTPSLKQKLAKAAWERDEKRDNAVGGIGDTQESNRRFRDEPTSNFTRTMRAQWESDDEDDDFLDMSPPKTIQFDLPKRPLLQTPGKSLASCSLLFANGLQLGKLVDASWMIFCSPLAPISPKRWKERRVPASSQ